MFHLQTLVVLSLRRGAEDGCNVLTNGGATHGHPVHFLFRRIWRRTTMISPWTELKQCVCCEVRTHCLKAVSVHFIKTNAPCCVDRRQIGDRLEAAIVVHRIRALNACSYRDLVGGEPSIPVTCKAPVPTKNSDGHSASIFTVNREIVFVRNVVTT